MKEIVRLKGHLEHTDISVYAEEQVIEFVGDEGDIIYISPEDLLYVLQEYQTKIGPIKVHVDTSSWRGIVGSQE